MIQHDDQHVLSEARLQCFLPTFLARLDGRVIQVRVGLDGQLWTWQDGQQHLAASGDAATAWCRQHINSDDLARAERMMVCRYREHCRPGG